MVLNDEQQALVDTMSELLRERSPVSAVRTLRDDPERGGFDRALWMQLVEMGLPYSALHEDNGGLGFGYLGLGAVFIELGKQLTATPLLSTTVLAAGLVEMAAPPERCEQLLTPLLDGRALATLAHDEGRHFCGMSIRTRLSGHAVNGTKTMVSDAQVADQLLVSARSDEGQWLVLLIEAGRAGVTINPRRFMNGRNFSTVELKDVAITDADILARGDVARDALATVLDRATIFTAAEMLGAAEAVFQQTVDYLKVRKQFGVAIGSFQALQHRCSALFVELQLLRSQVLAALAAIDGGSTGLSSLASQCKATANEVMDLATAEAVQMHGGIGVTEELDVGLYLKHTPVCRRLLGDTGFHLDRFATSAGI